MDVKFKNGAIVQLKCGGPRMVVMEDCDDAGLRVIWVTTEGEIRIQVLPSCVFENATSPYGIQMIPATAEFKKL